MKQPNLDQQVFQVMLPRPLAGGPHDFAGIRDRYLIPEVRAETQAFYGQLRHTEEKFPGLNYAYGPHRMRLSRFDWHRRLFRAFDKLELTETEILRMTKWEGTLWARERYQRERGFPVKDTTGHDIKPWVPWHERPASESPSSQNMVELKKEELAGVEGFISTDEEAEVEVVTQAAAEEIGDQQEAVEEEMEDDEDDEDEDGEDEEDEEEEYSEARYQLDRQSLGAPYSVEWADGGSDDDSDDEELEAAQEAILRGATDAEVEQIRAVVRARRDEQDEHGSGDDASGEDTETEAEAEVRRAAAQAARFNSTRSGETDDCNSGPIISRSVQLLGAARAEDTHRHNRPIYS